jgi:hypothetical protein
MDTTKILPVYFKMQPCSIDCSSNSVLAMVFRTFSSKKFKYHCQLKASKLTIVNYLTQPLAAALVRNLNVLYETTSKVMYF